MEMDVEQDCAQPGHNEQQTETCTDQEFEWLGFILVCMQFKDNTVHMKW